MHEPPVQSDYHAFKATVLLIPISGRHNELPLVVATGNRFTERRCINAEFLKWKPKYGYTGRTDLSYCAPLKPVTTVQKSANSCEPSKKPSPRRFFVWPLRYDRQSSASRNRMRIKIMQPFIPNPSILFTRDDGWWALIVSTPLDFKEDV